MIEEKDFYNAVVALFNSVDEIKIRTSVYTDSSIKILKYLKKKCRPSDIRNAQQLNKLWKKPNVQDEVKKRLLAKTVLVDTNDQDNDEGQRVDALTFRGLGNEYLTQNEIMMQSEEYNDPIRTLEAHVTFDSNNENGVTELIHIREHLKLLEAALAKRNGEVKEAEVKIAQLNISLQKSLAMNKTLAAKVQKYRTFGSQWQKNHIHLLKKTLCDLEMELVNRGGYANNGKVTTSKGSRSGNPTPGSASRPGSAKSTSTSVSGVINRRSVNSARNPRPASIVSTGMTTSCKADISIENVSKQKKDRPPLPKMSIPRRSTTAASSITLTPLRSTDTPKRGEKRVPFANKKSTTPRAITPVQSNKSLEVVPNVITETVSIEQTTEIPIKNDHNETNLINPSDTSNTTTEQTIELVTVPAMEQLYLETTNDLSSETNQERTNTNEILIPQQQESEMTASMIAKRYTNEEAALAKRCRIAREEAEKQAELKRQHKETEELTEQQRIAEEEKNQRRLEEETLRLVEEQKKAEELLLLQANEEAKQKEEEERQRKEIEEIARIEREESERKAREEAEKQKLETAEKLRKEEKEREESRKRVEAIMSREEAENQAELERIRKEAEELAEQQRIAEKEKNQRRLEEETLRLVEEQKKAEELLLLQANEEAKQKEEEERQRKEIEEIARIEREESERKAREEAEKQKLETAEKLRKEEKEREESRKRVEAIMSREEAENQAELERIRKEAEELAEQQRIAEKEKNQRRLEEETLRLVEEQKKAEELLLLQANEEAKQKEEEERQRKEIEEIARIEREESERKAREEAEKQKLETAEKLRKEEKEREESRKRVETIMSRTRKGGAPKNTSNKDGNREGDQISPSNSDSNLVKIGTNENNFTTQNNVNMAIYEMSVTNKKSASINSFSNLIENQYHPTLNVQEQNAKTNGKSDIDANDRNLIMKSAISNGNGHTDPSLDNELEPKEFSSIDNKTQEMMTGQLIDINMDFNESSTPVNFNNNSLVTSTNLVVSGSSESKEYRLFKGFGSNDLLKSNCLTNKVEAAVGKTTRRSKRTKMNAVAITSGKRPRSSNADGQTHSLQKKQRGK